MNDFLSAYITRIFIGGIICAGALSITGGGTKREVTRVCCACVMLILVLSPLKNKNIDWNSLKYYSADTQEYVNDAIAKTKSAQARDVTALLCQNIKLEAKKEGIHCDIEIKYILTDDGLYDIEEVIINCQGGDQNRLREIAMTATGVTFGKITFEEG